MNALQLKSLFLLLNKIIHLLVQSDIIFLVTLLAKDTAQNTLRFYNMPIKSDHQRTSNPIILFDGVFFSTSVLKLIVFDDRLSCIISFESAMLEC